ncbi:MAG: prefoldin subunit alpha, partial [Candidatus Aenigmarchaeota archaeon]|nr:prefoldin subunit alpha [Candidatus Aenigmarchaeota archaeon]
MVIKIDQTKMLQLEILKEQGQQMAQQKSQISMQVQELEYTKNTIKDLKNAKKGTEMMIPIGTGMYVKGKIESVDDIITAIGGNVAVGKTLDDVKEIIDERMKRMKELETQIDSELENIDSEGEKLVKELQGAQEKE